MSAAKSGGTPAAKAASAGKPAGKSAGKPTGTPAARKRPRRAGRGALGIISGLMIAAGLIRITDGVGKVIALETTVHTGDAGAAAAPGDCTPDGGTAALLAALRERETTLASHETALEERKQALGIAEDRISARLEQLKAAEAELSSTLALADSASEDDLARLTTVYENMKPKEAALLFSEMEPDFAAGFLARMRPDAAAAVMAGLDPKIAYGISAVLAGRNATVPKN